MIRSVRGQVASVTGDVAVVEVGGVGLALACTPTTLAGLRVGTAATLAASLVVREDSLTLYGFLDDDERLCFEVLQTATGVGPRLALAMLAVHSPEALRRAVATEDLVALVQVSGVGRKGAQRLVLELKDRLGPPTGSSAPAPRQGPAPWRDQLGAALLSLGWSTRQVEDAVAEVSPEAEEAAAATGTEPDVGDLLRAALRTLGRR